MEMSALEIVGGIAMILISIVIIVAVLLQESTKGGAAALTGGDSYYDKNSGRTIDAMLSRITKYSAILFFLVTIAVYVVVERL